MCNHKLFFSYALKRTQPAAHTRRIQQGECSRHFWIIPSDDAWISVRCAGW